MPAMKNKKILFRVINIAIAVLFGLVLVYFLLHDLDVQEIKKAFLGMYVPSLLLFIAINFSDTFFRAYRKKILIGSPRINMFDMFFTNLIRNAFNMVLPARTGELSYVYVLTRKFKFPVEIGVSTLLVAMIFDLVIVFSLIIISLIMIIITTGLSDYIASPLTLVLIAAGLLGVFALILFHLSKVIDLFIKGINKILTRYRIGRNKTIQLLYCKLVETNKNIEIIQKRKIYTKVYFSSLAIRIMKFSSYYILIHAILRPMGYSFSSLDYWVILLATIAAEISAVLPTHALAGFGTYEGAFAGTAVLLNFVGFELARIVAFSYHITILIFSLSLGIISMIIISMPFYKVRGLEEIKR
jgi:glycosyltransferase 2 family protein